MELSVLYADDEGKAVERELFDTLKVRQILYKENDLLKKVEFYADGQMFITYYLGDEEFITDILEQFGNSRVDIIKRVHFDGYTIEESKDYRDKTLLHLSKQLYNSFGNQICDQLYDHITGAPILKGTEKYLYIDPIASSDICSLGFEYDENGLVYRVWGWLVENTDKRQKGYIYKQDLPLYFPDLLIKYPYYKTATLLPE